MDAVRSAGACVALHGWDAGEATIDHDDLDERAATVAHLVPEHLAGVRTALAARRARGPVVCHTVWETDRLPDHWPGLLRQADRVIVPSEWNREVFAGSGVSVPISVVPHVADLRVRSTAASLPGTLEERLTGRVVFYVIGRWDDRKAVDLTVRAYLEAFTADDPVALVVKSKPLIEMRPVAEWGRSNPRAFTSAWQVAYLLRSHPSPAAIHLEVGEWTADEIRALHRRGDCYVSLAHSEGWGLGAFDAATYGNPVIASGWSGHLEYLAGSELLVGGDLVPVRSVGSSYQPTQRWFEPDVAHAVSLLRAVFDDLDRYRTAAEPIRDAILSRFGPSTVGPAFLDAVT